MGKTILLLAFALISVGTAARQSQPVFSLTISAANETIKPGSEFKLSITIHNTSRVTFVSGRWVGGPDYSFKIDVRDTQGKLAQSSEHYRAMLQGNELNELPMGSSTHYYVGPDESMTQVRKRAI